jgi:sterol 24-C-methyltransferase
MTGPAHPGKEMSGMDIAEYFDIIESAERRAEYYHKMVRFYYEFATGHYLAGWGDSFHLTWFAPGQDLRTAQRAQELWVAEQGGFGSGMRVLDVGCGVGGPTAVIASHTGAHVTGVNISPLQVELARRRVPEPASRGLTDYEVGDAMDLPSAWHGAFDGAYSIEVICHTPDKARAYRQIADVLRPGASFVGCDWFTRDGIEAGDYARAIEPLCQTFALPNLISMTGFREYLENAGFAIGSLSQYSDHGDVSPNWTLANAAQDALSSSHEESDEQKVLRESLRLLRDGFESGDFVLGCWVARKVAR